MDDRLNEMGSEYWLNEDELIFYHTLKDDASIAYVLSGRTAIDFIIRDIRAVRGFESVYIPSYCCESMIEPFLRNHIHISFYEVQFSEGGVRLSSDDINKCDAILLIDYFGYKNPDLISIAKNAASDGVIVIYDETHMLNGNSHIKEYAHYTFCSYRKWFYGNVAKVWTSGLFNVSKPVFRLMHYEMLRNEGARLKWSYMKGAPVEKQEFLSLFGEAEALLEHEYMDKAAEPRSISRIEGMDFSTIIAKRRENAKYLIKELRKINFPWLKTIVSELGASDCPLFVPVQIDVNLRNQVRELLTFRGIYCPIHWPLSLLHRNENLLDSWLAPYYSELSLICDQRYNLSNMDKIVQILIEIGRIVG